MPIVTVSMIVINTIIFFSYPLQSEFDITDISDDQFNEVMQDMRDQGLITEEEYVDAIEKLGADDLVEVKTAPADGDPLTLQYGRGLRPWQWITGHFLHADFLHLFGNMLWLWTFGLIVEGKIGWQRFLAVYFGIAVVEGFMEQTLMLGMEPDPWNCSVGASSIIFGIMAMAMVWAPANDVHCNILLIPTALFSAPVAGLGGFYLIYSVIITVFFTYNGEVVTPTSELLHALGGIVGLVLGVAMVHYRMVDCENWDLFSVWAGRNRMSREELAEQARSKTDYEAREQPHLAKGLGQIRAILREQSSPQLAYRAHMSMKQKYANWELPDAEFLMIIKQLCSGQHWDDAMLAMGEYLKSERSKQDQVRLKLASILVDQQGRPSQCLSVLSKVEKKHLNARENAIYQQLSTKASRMKDEGVIDTLEDW